MNRILVTGGAGFIGSNFVHYCLNKNDKVLNFDILTYAGNLDNLKNIENNDNYTFVKGNICDKKLLDECLDNFQPNFIVNFAAESRVDRSIDRPENFINTNVVGTYQLLSSCLQYYSNINDDSHKSKFMLLHISTDEVYGSLGEEGFFNENSNYNPNSPYSASKASSDHIVSAWFKTYGLPTIITNCSNNYGPYQFPEKLIPHMIHRCLKEKKLPIYGNGKNMRDWIFVTDHCEALYQVLNKGSRGDNYIIGGDEEKSNIEVVQMICKILNTLRPSINLKTYEDLIEFVKDRPGHDYRYAIDCSKIKKELKWSQKVSFDEGLLKTINWYLENLEWTNKIINEKYSLNRIGI